MYMHAPGYPLCYAVQSTCIMCLQHMYMYSGSYLWLWLPKYMYLVEVVHVQCTCTFIACVNTVYFVTLAVHGYYSIVGCSNLVVLSAGGVCVVWSYTSTCGYSLTLSSSFPQPSQVLHSRKCWWCLTLKVMFPVPTVLLTCIDPTVHMHIHVHVHVV